MIMAIRMSDGIELRVSVEARGGTPDVVYNTLPDGRKADSTAIFP